ncbi:ABC transporter permease [Paucibacter sp. M5-1]|uniref:ABC transporter permease n=1 Tax=Paucibacter sp. M5-1 TaxID=3015998 RepID=UPI0022B900B6|nr:ABC transporter permease [Paucibacter sp. M5-1]MCZ7880081.1 ABC transporter permease [Paucibacter sp. M5-1]
MSTASTNPLGATLVRLRAQILKELLCVLRDPKSRMVLIVPPLMQLLIFAFAATLEVKQIDVAVYNRDAGRAGQELVQQLAASQLVRRLHPARSEAQIAALIDRQQVVAALLIPENFSRDQAAGRPATAQVLLDGRRANSTQVALGYLQTIAARAGATLTGQAPAEPAALRHAFNPNLIYQWFIVPSLVGILVTFITLLVTSLSIARERELGTFDQLLVSPCTPMEIIVAKMVPAFLVGTGLASVMVGAAVWGFRIPFTGSLGLLFLCLLLFILSMVGTGLMISSVCSTQQQAILGTFAVGVPAVLMSGFATPVENMPQALQWAAEALPLKHFLIILRGSFLKAMPSAELFANAWPMACIAAVTLGLATLFVRSKLQ